MIYSGSGFLPVVSYLAPPPTLPLPSVSSTGETQTKKERRLADGREGRGWWRNQIILRKKAWSSVNHSILPGLVGHLLSVDAYPKKTTDLVFRI